VPALGVKERSRVGVEATTFPVLLHRNHREHGQKPAVVTDKRSISHAELDDKSRSVAAGLVTAGVNKGARVGLLAPNGVEWAVTAAAVLRIGGVLVPLSTLLRPPELEAQLHVADITHLVVAPTFRGRDYLDEIESVAPGVSALTRAGRRHNRLPLLRHIWPIDELPQATVGDGVVTALEDAVRPADDLVVLFTSGSRGTPKGVIHTHGNGIRAVASGLEARCIGPDDRVYIPMPFFWTGGFSSGLLSVLVAGATLLTEAVPEPERTLDLLEREQATLFRGWPDQAARLASVPAFASTDLSRLGPGSLPAVLPSGRRPAPGTRANLFGMTETFGPYCGARVDVDLPETGRGSCGLPFDGFELRIADPESRAPLPTGQLGEICIRGPNMMRGICGRSRDETFDTDGFYATGDLGSLDTEGFLRYQGRADDMFKVNGATVYPAEVEAAIRAIENVKEAHVTNVRGSDGGDLVGVLVVSSAPLDELVAGARERLSAFKVPTCWLVTASADKVPMTTTAKVDKVALRALLEREGQPRSEPRTGTRDRTKT
jgi:acyl-CoA synthetase (AMP-forming)/AMP-acid ligase II